MQHVKDDSQTSDIDIVVSGNTYKLHKVVLYAACPTMLTFDFSSLEFEVKEDLMHTLLHFIYIQSDSDDYLEDLEIEDSAKLIKLSYLLNFRELREWCQNIFLRSLQKVL